MTAKLEKIILKDFKSYKGEYVIGPFDNFSCIIGPNGSGKSNILDGITFALGVNTKNLRVSSLSELINQSEIKTSVKLIFVISDEVVINKLSKKYKDIFFNCNENFNNDKKTIIFEREFNKNRLGSTYKINGITKQLNEYTKILENELNIYSKIKNFIIYQNSIISTNPDLLGIIETVSNSVEYKEEYEKLQNLLIMHSKELSRKLDRKKDLMGDLKEIDDSNVKRMTFNALLDKKEDLSKKLYACEIHSLWEKKKRAEELFMENSHKLKRIVDNEEYQKMKREIVKVSQLISETRKELDESSITLEMVTDSSSIKRGGLFNKESSITDKESRILHLQNKLKRLHPKIDYSGICSNEEESKVIFEDQLDKLISKFHEETKLEESSLSKITIENFDRISEREELLKEIKLKESEIDKRSKEIAEEVYRKNKNREKIKMLEIEKQGLIIPEDQKVEFIKIKAAIDEDSDKVKLITKEILLGKAKQQWSKSRIFLVNTVETLKSLFTGVLGKISEIISPIQEKYKIALNGLLVKYENSILVTDKETAILCINYLKTAKLMKLSFIVLESVECYNGDNLLGEDSIMKYVKSDYPQVVTFLLKRCSIVETSEEAKILAYSGKGFSSVISLEGILFNSNGLITGGIYNNNNNKNISNIEDKLITRRSLIGKIQDNKSKKDLYTKIERAIVREEEILEEIKKLELECINDNVRPISPDILEDLRKKKELLYQVNILLSNFENTKSQLLSKIAAKETEILFPLLKLVNISSLNEYKKRVNQGDMRMEIEIELLNLQNELEIFMEDNRNIYDNSNSINKDDLIELKNKVFQLQNKLDSLRGKSKEINLRNSKVAVDVEVLTDRIKSYSLMKSKISDEIEDKIKQCFIETEITDEGDIEREFMLIQDVHKNENMHNNSIKGRFNVISYIREIKESISKVSIELASNTPTENLGSSDLQSKFLKFSKEYDEAKKYTGTIREHFYNVKSQRLELFNSCLQGLQEKINIIYRRLAHNVFENSEGNGNVAYVVFEGTLPFISNSLKYYVMPPNKGFIEFKLLSGGEKSLALLAFILAINKVCDSPGFYLLDEIDQALDRENIERLANFLREDSKDIQYLLISLKSQLFSNAESLFGVYKDPIELKSKVLSYKLNSL